MANKTSQFSSFTEFSSAEMNGFLSRFYAYYKGSLDLMGINEGSIKFSKETLAEIINRVEKRRIYFFVFYNKTEMSELNEIALFCFWIAKLKPFSCETDHMINDKIAIFFFIHRLNKNVHDFNNNPDNKGNKLRLNLTSRILKIIAYDFRYRDISKEALMTIGESLIYENPCA